MHYNSELLFEKYGKGLFQPNTRVLELGPDQIPTRYQEIVGLPSITWETLDIRGGRRDTAPTYVSENEYAFPVDSSHYDIVLSGQVIEHVRRIWVWMRELARVCRPGGLVITICPVTWPYHEDPVDCWRIYPEGFKALLYDAGLEPELVICEAAESPLDLRTKKWFLLKQALKGFVGRQPFLSPLTPAWLPTMDTIAIARRP